MLWVDAVCINQDDLLERSAQVPCMPQIYRSARRVLTWLGSGAESSELAFLALGNLGKQVELTASGVLVSSPNSEHQDWHQSQVPLLYDDATWHALDCLFQRPIFERLWIVQESHLSNRQSIWQCGHDQVSWSLARRAAACLSQKNLPLVSLQARLGSIGDTLYAFRLGTQLTLFLR